MVFRFESFVRYMQEVVSMYRTVHRGVWQPDEDLDKRWKQWVLKRFYQAVVLPIFDLGGLAFYLDPDAEKEWKDTFGQAGLLQTFVLTERSHSWHTFWSTAREQSKIYLTKAESKIREMVSRLPEDQRYILEDALCYDMLEDMHKQFESYIEQDLPDSPFWSCLQEKTFLRSSQIA